VGVFIELTLIMTWAETFTTEEYWSTSPSILTALQPQWMSHSRYPNLPAMLFYWPAWRKKVTKFWPWAGMIHIP
jgi:hypothetical protein